MEEYSFKQVKRKIKQIILALVFMVILIFSWHYPLLGYFIPLCMLLGLGISFRRGRKWCDWYCPRGSFYDGLISNISSKREIPVLFKNIYFRIGILIILMLAMTFNLINRWPYAYSIGMFFVMLITITTVLGIILALIFHQRTWCLICPIGTMANLIGRDKRSLKINSDLCVECKLCAKVCPIQIKPYRFKSQRTQIIRDGDCLKCNLCIAACPKKALSR